MPVYGQLKAECGHMVADVVRIAEQARREVARALNSTSGVTGVQDNGGRQIRPSASWAVADPQGVCQCTAYRRGQ